MTTNLSTRRIIVTDFSAFYLQDGGEKRREMGHSPHRYETKLRHCHAMYMASGAGATCLVAEGSVGSGHYRPATLADVNFSLCMLWMAPYWVTRARVCVGGPALRRLSLSTMTMTFTSRHADASQRHWDVSHTSIVHWPETIRMPRE